MGLEEAYHYLGKWGRWQLIIYSIICLSFGLPSIWQLMAIVFIGKLKKKTKKIDFMNKLLKRDPNKVR